MLGTNPSDVLGPAHPAQSDAEKLNVTLEWWIILSRQEVPGSKCQAVNFPNTERLVEIYHHVTQPCHLDILHAHL
jgi:hypothetical protein